MTPLPKIGLAFETSECFQFAIKLGVITEYCAHAQ